MIFVEPIKSQSASNSTELVIFFRSRNLVDIVEQQRISAASILELVISGADLIAAARYVTWLAVAVALLLLGVLKLLSSFTKLASHWPLLRDWALNAETSFNDSS